VHARFDSQTLVRRITAFEIRSIVVNETVCIIFSIDYTMMLWCLFFYFISAKNVEIRLLLKLQNIDELTEKFWRISDSTPHLSQTEMTNRYSSGQLV
jgi:hypothetical protein